jgi:hypothetical protein
MTVVRAEEYTQALGQVISGSWRRIARAKKLGIPQALGLSLEDWVMSRLGGYVRLSVADRREAVKELTDQDLSTREIGNILGVSQPKTVALRILDREGQKVFERHKAEPPARAR